MGESQSSYSYICITSRNKMYKSLFFIVLFAIQIASNVHAQKIWHQTIQKADTLYPSQTFIDKVTTSHPDKADVFFCSESHFDLANYSSHLCIISQLCKYDTLNIIIEKGGGRSRIIKLLFIYGG